MELIKIDDEQFGKLIELPKLYDSFATSCLNAENAANLHLSALEVVNLETVDPTFMEGILGPVIMMQESLKLTLDKFVNGRTPYTKKMTDVAGSFIDLEKRVKAKNDKFAEYRNKWELEKSRRNRVAAALAETNRLADVKRINDGLQATKELNARFALQLSQTITRMHVAFNEKTIETLPAFSGVLASLKSFDIPDDAWSIIKGPNTVVQKGAYAVQWFEALASERDNLVALTDSRIAELKRGEDDSAKRTAEAVAASVEVVNDNVQAAELSASVEKLESSFSFPAAVAMTKAKGATTKQKYVVATHKDFIKILTAWVANDMNELTPEELAKKIGFMTTAANYRLNAKVNPVAIEGLVTVEDISTKRGV